MVLNPVALDVPISVFRATHHPSLLRWEGATAGTSVPVSEREFLEDFLDAKHSHVFDVAVGDSGTGKSHFIRWLHQETLHRSAKDKVERHIVPIPRSSANLADVLRRILKDFGGETTRRLREEVERHHGLSEAEARQRVLDEIAIAVEHAAAPADEDEITRYVRSLLPALLRDQAVRNELCSRKGGITHWLARHVLGRRETGDVDQLRWQPSDLEFRAAITVRAGEEARELADGMRTDDEMRRIACALLDRAHGPALAALLRFRSGDLKRSLEEIRQQLRQQRKELVLLIEDLSITEGIDGELLEALQVRTHDTGTELCTLRSIIGVTNEDHLRMRENIKGRVLRTLRFDVPLGADDPSREQAVLAEFAARYLNAARLDESELDVWNEAGAVTTPPSACEECPNRPTCHRAFGEIGGYGTYPFTATALGRLYRRVAGEDARTRAFNPRLLLRRVLSATLEEAERSLPRGDFPPRGLIAAFDLSGTTAQLELALRTQLGLDGERVRHAIEMYAEHPSVDRPELPSGIATAFALRLPDIGPAPALPAVKRTNRPVAEPQPVEPQLDAFDRWLRKEEVADSDLNAWRVRIHEAISATIDWDTEGLAPLKSSFGRASIYLEGQFTRIHGPPILEVMRSAEAAITLRTLAYPTTRKLSSGRQNLLVARTTIERWAASVREALASRFLPPKDADPIALAVRILAIGAFLRGQGGRSLSEAEMLDHALKLDWEVDRTAERGSAWSALLRAYNKTAPKVQRLVVHALGCTKGGDAGNFLEPSGVLEILSATWEQPSLGAAPEDAASWGIYKDVAELALAVQQHLEQARSEEFAAAEGWRARVQGWTGDDSLSNTLTWLREAREAAETTGLLNAPLRDALAHLEDKPVDKCLATVSDALNTKEEATRLNALGRMSRPLMAQIERCLDLADRMLTEWTGKLQKQLQDAHGGADSTQLAQEIRDALKSIATDYQTFLETESTDG
ncbi:protein DpdH [Sorangium sp. So ce124]|uniref:protein DpdH n=1 Tax=Sorangium sp. So ce124 TaxID=3133280 RepID=UPI003F5F2924